jgi:hypothetical protein
MPSRKGSRKGSKKLSRKEEEKIFRRSIKNQLKKHGSSLRIPSVWKHPVTGNQVPFSSRAKRVYRELRKEMGIKGPTSYNSKKKRSGSRKKRSSRGRGAVRLANGAKGDKAGKRSCQTKLKNKIRINMAEYKKGRFSSRQQALAVSYAQVKKKSPSCKKYFKR